MTWEKGKSGNPEGARVKARRFGAILDRVAAQEAAKAEEDNRIRKAIDKQVDKAVEGDLASLQFIAERLDGKMPQQLDHGNADGEPFKVVVEATDANL